MKASKLSEGQIAYILRQVGDRTAGAQVNYPADDIQAVLGNEGEWHFTDKNGEAY